MSVELEQAFINLVSWRESKSKLKSAIGFVEVKGILTSNLYFIWSSS